MSNSQKIAFLYDNIDYGGVAKIFCKLARNLENSKIYTFQINNQELATDVNVVKLANGSIIKQWFELFRMIIREQNDVLFLTPTIFVVLIILTKKIFSQRTKVILCVHMRPKFYFINSVEKVLLGKIIQLGFRYADQLVVVSNDLKNEITQLGITNKPINVIYNPVLNQSQIEKTEKIKKIEEEKLVQIAIVGWIYSLKGQFDVIQAIKLLNEKVEFTKYQLNIYGAIKSEEYYQEIKKYILKNELDQYVHFKGYKSNILEELVKNDLLVLASTDEALPTVIIEALAKKVPIVASDCMWGPREILQDEKYGLLYPVGDIVGLQQQILKVTNNNNLYNYYANQGIKRALDFSDKNFEKYKMIIEKEIRNVFIEIKN